MYDVKLKYDGRSLWCLGERWSDIVEFFEGQGGGRGLILKRERRGPSSAAL
jgi:hypothetical protein